MRILYVLPETSVTGGSGIATYHRHASRVLSEAGHETCTLTWKVDTRPSQDTQEVEHIDSNFVCINIEKEKLARDFGSHPLAVAISLKLAEHVERYVAEWNPDVIETSDYLAPLYGYLARRRAGILKKQQQRPVIAYNHGMLREIYRADARLPDMWKRQEFAAERTALRWADRVLVPSAAAMTKMQRQMGRVNQAVLCPEPYVPGSMKGPADKPADRYVHMGRVDYAKGVDTAAHLINILQTMAPIDEIVMIGGVSTTPFRTPEGDQYFLSRLPRKLRSRVRFTGRVSFDERSAALDPDGAGGYSLHFSDQETFNYVFLEMLDEGLVPLTMARTAMAEFLPAHLDSTLIPQAMEIDTVRPAIEAIRARPAAYLEEIREHAFALTSPAAFLERYEQQVAQLCEKPARTIRPILQRVYTANDVTVLMATYNPGPSIEESVASVLSQTRMPGLIILDDGSDDPAAIARLDALAARGNSIVLHRSPANEGLCATRRKLIRHCETELAILMDDDDLLDSHYVEKTLASMNDNPVGADSIVTLRQNFEESEERVLNFNLEDHELLLTNDYRMTALIRTAVLRDVDFSPTLRNGEADDWDFWNRFREKGHKLVLYPEALFKYRFRQGSMSWPWSAGQTALTAELVSRSAANAIRSGTVPEDFLLDVYCALLSPDQTTERSFMSHKRKTHRILGTILYFLHKQSYSLAKRL